MIDLDELKYKNKNKNDIEFKAIKYYKETNNVR